MIACQERRRQRLNREDDFPGHVEAGAGGCQHSEVAASREQQVAEARTLICQMLTVVEHKKRAALGQEACDRTVYVRCRFGGQAQNGGKLVADQGFVGNRRKIYEPDSARKRMTDSSRKFDREARLANAGNANERNQSTFSQQRRGFAQLDFATNEGVERGRNVSASNCRS